MSLQAFYTLTELIQLASTTRRKLTTLLRVTGIPSPRIGKRKVVFISDIKKFLPQLWESLLALEQARALERALADTSAELSLQIERD